ncbi:efflux RND transporter periplasmic adaptor subunit [Achromobacter aloeverae]|uniref:Efflux RND transporter periplasmic adaptor subunit n=1 Tax=Achromobacter aloeverae TaxID=1750518 RepID=A0A4Q1HF84_9BURK|nr:efflux RND transporter periplasmic adaptor subunit [Achromobacter aloeverae]RXN84467.1 efflux RND transporter periplasmic adaptor subunit [Achromobacter aloeverae]
MSYRRRADPALVAGTAILLAGALAACSPAAVDDPRAGVPLVRVATVQAPAPATRSYTGVVVARVQSDLGFRVGGKVTERLVDTGQQVRRGQPLMRIDATDLVLATRAREQAVHAAQARARQSAADEKRYRELVGAGAVSASAYDQIHAAADTARAELSAAQAQADVARNESGYATLYADADGVVMTTLAEPGQVVTAGQTVVRLARSGPREAVIDLPETLRPALGSVGEARLYGGQGPAVAARLRELSDYADPRTRTFQARFVLDPDAPQAPLGATISVSLGGAGDKPVVQVPLAALHDAGRGPGVWMLSGDPAKVTWRAVRVASLGEETATISAGLAPGERFVALGAHLLHEGELVQAVPPSPSPLAEVRQ